MNGPAVARGALSGRRADPHGFSLLAVFLCLAALYESWSIPFAVLLAVPLGVLGAVLGATMRGMPNDVFFKVGLITVIGLSAKNAILIIEFAKDLVAQGKGLVEATLEAVHLRFRPILMTSLAFILGVLPLVISSGPARQPARDRQHGVDGRDVHGDLPGDLLRAVFFVVVRGSSGPQRWRRRRRPSPGAAGAGTSALRSGSGGRP